jgi:hypothetical protein
MFTRLPGVLARIADPTVSTPDGFGVGSRLDELVDAGVTLELGGADRRPVTEIAEIVNGVPASRPFRAGCRCRHRRRRAGATDRRRPE